MNQLFNPEGIYIDSKSNIFVADSLNHRIMMFYEKIYKGLVLFGGRGKKDYLIQLFKPVAIICDEKEKRIIVSDSKNNRILI